MTEAKIAFILINFIAPDIHEDASHKHTVELQWREYWWLVYRGLFELIFESLRNFCDGSRKQILMENGLFELIFESLRNFSISSRKQILREILLFYNDIVYCVYSLELLRQF